MVYVSQFLARPSSLKDRDVVSYKDISITKIENDTISFIVKRKYLAEIWFSGGDINYQSAVKFHCDCKSFMYQFAHILFKKNGLLYPLNQSIILPKKQHVTYICKHLEACLRGVIKYTYVSDLKGRRHI